MDFEFDPAKAAGNLRKHRVAFSDAEGVFMDALALHRIDPDAEGEERFVAVGAEAPANCWLLSYTLRGEKIRLISARRATPAERRAYES